MYHARADMNNGFIQALNYNVAKYDAMCGIMMMGHSEGQVISIIRLRGIHNEQRFHNRDNPFIRVISLLQA